MKNQKASVVLCVGLMGLSLAGVVDAALISRAGGHAVYDTDNNLTWVTDANLSSSFSFGLTQNTVTDRFTFDGEISWYGGMNWVSAQQWIAGMNTAGYLGVNGWRMPSANPLSTPGVFGEFSQLFYNELGGTVNHPITDSASHDLAFFSNLDPLYSYWNDQQSSFGLPVLTEFSFNDGVQTSASDFQLNRVWAVHSGDVLAPVPVPASFWLMISGLSGLLGWTRWISQRIKSKS